MTAKISRRAVLILEVLYFTLFCRMLVPSLSDHALVLLESTEPFRVRNFSDVSGGERMVHQVPGGRILPRLPSRLLLQKGNQFNALLLTFRKKSSLKSEKAPNQTKVSLPRLWSANTKVGSIKNRYVICYILEVRNPHIWVSSLKKVTSCSIALSLLWSSPAGAPRSSCAWSPPSPSSCPPLRGGGRRSCACGGRQSRTSPEGRRNKLRLCSLVRCVRAITQSCHFPWQPRRLKKEGMEEKAREKDRLGQTKGVGGEKEKKIYGRTAQGTEQGWNGKTWKGTSILGASLVSIRKRKFYHHTFTLLTHKMKAVK